MYTLYILLENTEATINFGNNAFQYREDVVEYIVISEQNYYTFNKRKGIM